MIEHGIKPPSSNVLFDPGTDNIPSGRVKKWFYRSERLNRPLLKAAPIGHFRIIFSDSRHV
jgi:hypothetical protein